MELKGGELCMMILTWVLKGGLFCFPLEEKGKMRSGRTDIHEVYTPNSAIPSLNGKKYRLACKA